MNPDSEQDCGSFFPSYFLQTSTEEFPGENQNSFPLCHGGAVQQQSHDSGNTAATDETSSIEQQVASGSMNVSDATHPMTPSAEDSSHGAFGANAADEPRQRQNHSEIEKRRREKMNSCIKELATILPVCSGMSRKLDKLTVLRMAVQHLKSIKGSLSAFMPGSQVKPEFLSNKKIHELILKVAEGFLFVVSCDRGKILFVSESVAQVLNYSREELIGQNWFDILHPKDVAKVKEQLTSNDLMKKKERFVDAKTMLPVESDFNSGKGKSAATAAASQSPGLSAFSPGARRSFFCRMKCKSLPKSNDEADTTTGLKNRKNASERKYIVIYCMGYIKSWSSSMTSTSSTGSTLTRESVEDSDDAGCNLSCLVAAARTLPPFTAPSAASAAASSSEIPTAPMEFVSRHSMDGKFLFVDQRAVFILGFLPQEMLGTSNYEYCHPDDVKFLADGHRRALASTDEVNSGAYRFKTKSGSYLYFQTSWKMFKNPWTKDFEFLVARNTCVPAPEAANIVESSSFRPDVLMSHGGHRSQVNHLIKTITKSGPSSGEYSSGSSSENRVRQLLSSNRVNLWKIGKQIADEAIDNHKKYENESGGSVSSRSNVSSNVSSPSLSNEASGEHMSAKNGSNGGGTSDPGSHNSEGSSGNSIYSTSFYSHQLEQETSCDVTNSQNLLTLPSFNTVRNQSSVSSCGDPVLADFSNSLTPQHLYDLPISSAAASIPNPVQPIEPAAAAAAASGPSMDPALPGTEPGPADIDEAAMALVMSLLEADAGLGDRVDCSSLPWPLF